MTIYVLAQLKFTDRAAYNRYQSRFMSVFSQVNGRMLAADEHPIPLEGQSDRDKVVLMSFPDEASARRFIDSAEYQEISKDRRAGADTVSWLVRGLG